MDTIKACQKCGGSDRYLSGACRICKHAYMAAHRADKKAYNVAYRLRHKEEIRAAKAAKYALNRLTVISKAVDYKQGNLDRARATDRRWAKNNSDKVAAKVQKRKARKLQATPGWFDEFDALVMKEAYNLAQRRSALTGIKWHVDHIVPLRSPFVSGFHIGSNIQVIPATANIMKSNRAWPDMPTCQTKEAA